MVVVSKDSSGIITPHTNHIDIKYCLRVDNLLGNLAVIREVKDLP